MSKSLKVLEMRDASEAYEFDSQGNVVANRGIKTIAPWIVKESSNYPGKLGVAIFLRIVNFKNSQLTHQVAFFSSTLILE